MDYFWLCLSAVAAGAVNAVAGGGTLLTFPTLISVLSAHYANAASVANGTSTVALFPASFASVWGYRQKMIACRRWAIWLAPPSILGGGVGALLVEEASFRRLIPWLILLAAVLFLLQPTIARLLKRQAVGLPGSEYRPRPRAKVLACIVGFQFLVGVYGGYFGAGIGILMLSSLAFLGLNDIHENNALKSFLAFCINIVAACLFIVRGLVAWEYALVMMAAAIVGGYVGARLSLLLRPAIVRWIVIVIGFSLATYYFWHQV
jgi:uncharacterized membrane protein YfcA